MKVILNNVWTVGMIARSVDGAVYGDETIPVNALTTDSREVTSGAVFVAIRGESADGHAYIAKAANMGAACILCEKMPETLPQCPIICVPDSVKALGRFAAAYKQAIAPLTVAITGSIGKTTTK